MPATISVSHTEQLPQPGAYKVKNTRPLDVAISIKLERHEIPIGKPLYYTSDNDKFFQHYRIPILARSKEKGRVDRRGPADQIGYIEATVILCGQIKNKGRTLRDVCARRSQEFWEMYLALHHENDLPKTYTVNLDYGDILYVREVRLEEYYRGYGIGLLAVDALISALPSFEQDSVILSPGGLNSEPNAQEENHDFGEGVDKLTEYWKLMGFNVWARETGEYHDVWMGIWTGCVRKRMEDVVPHLVK